MCCRKRLANISKPPASSNFMFLAHFCWVKWGNSKSDPPPKKMESNNKKTLPGCRLLFGGFWHKYTQSQSVWHLQIILAFGGIFVPGWLDLKTWEQWQHCCLGVFCVANCSSYSCWYISGKLWNLIQEGSSEISDKQTDFNIYISYWLDRPYCWRGFWQNTWWGKEESSCHKLCGYIFSCLHLPD